MLTLAKSRPILQVDIDLKALLAEAYHKGQQELLYVVPFVAKVLESCSKSKVRNAFLGLTKFVRVGIVCQAIE
jgi:CCR4-NOT transcription complex subunit 1